MTPARVELTIELARAFGLFAEAGVSVQRPVPATDAELELVHDPRYIAEVRLAGGDRPDAPMLGFFGLGTEDDPVFPGMHDASALVAGATLAAARAVWTGTAQHGASIAGGLHHAMELSIDAQRAAGAAIHELAHQVAGGRWLLTGGGGYELLQVVPRTWAHLLAEAAGHPIDPGARIPAAWREYAARGTGRLAPEFMTEGAQTGYASFESGYDPAPSTE